jgi:NADH-quinone oxidoreductase subunit E
MSLAQENMISALSEQEIEQIEDEVRLLPNRQAAAIDALKIVQGYRGWISDESLASIAKVLQMSTEELDGIATFYNLIYRHPVGEKVVLFCDSVSCWLMDGDKVCDRIKQKLRIEYGETTGDGKYTLLPVTCLGDCDHAPAMMIGEELHHDLDAADVDRLFDDSGDTSTGEDSS